MDRRAPGSAGCDNSSQKQPVDPDRLLGVYGELLVAKCKAYGMHPECVGMLEAIMHGWKPDRLPVGFVIAKDRRNL